MKIQQAKLDQKSIDFNVKQSVLFNANIQKLAQQFVSPAQLVIQNWPENSDFNKVVLSAPEIPLKYQKPAEHNRGTSTINYNPLKDELKWFQPLLSFGRLLFVVPKIYGDLDATFKQKNLDKYKSDIMLALQKIKSTPTGAAILKAACEPGLPVLVNLQIFGHAKNHYSTAEVVDEKNRV
jgi:hypothetical protein